MQIFVRAQDSHLVEFGESATVADVKAFVAQTEGIAAGEQVICYAGVPLEDDVAVSNFQALAALDVTARLVGGKVHGSLSRAGKVKNQTPKVAKAEDKKKKLTGRAKRRKQYSKRFIAAASKFGKKKGPNSNS